MSSARLTRRGLILAAPALLLTHQVFAHRAKLTLTSISWNDRSDMLEVEHRLHVHDALTALGRADPEAAPDLVALRNRAKLALLVEQDFSLTLPDGEAIALETIGAELEGDQLYVYQEAELDTAPDALIVDCRLLRRFFNDQGNHVNFKVGDKLTSLFFSGDDGAKIATH